jgi:TonB family protein
MKAILAVALIGFPFTLAFSAELKTAQLSPQKSAALPAHLTTRINWSQFPKPSYQNQDLKGQDRSAILRIYADETGQVTKAHIQESTGIDKLDQHLIKAVYAAQVKPHQVKDVTLPIIGYQVFNLSYQEDGNELCQYNFNSKAWQAQQQDKKVTFRYVNQPNLSLHETQLNDHDRRVKFKFDVNKKGMVKKVKITQGSGSYALDQQVKQAVQNAQVDVSRKYWLYKPNTLSDSIQFKLDECH